MATAAGSLAYLLLRGTWGGWRRQRFRAALMEAEWCVSSLRGPLGATASAPLARSEMWAWPRWKKHARSLRRRAPKFITIQCDVAWGRILYGFREEKEKESREKKVNGTCDGCK